MSPPPLPRVTTPLLTAAMLSLVGSRLLHAVASPLVPAAARTPLFAFPSFCAQAAALSWFVYLTTLVLVVGVVVLVLLKFNVQESEMIFENKAW